MELSVKAGKTQMKSCIIYRPPPSGQTRIKPTIFLDEWSNYLDRLTTIPFHFDDPTYINVRRFTGQPDAYGLVQHIIGATHFRGHTLDVIITRETASSSREVRLLSIHVCMIVEVKTQVTILQFRLHSIVKRDHFPQVSNHTSTAFDYGYYKQITGGVSCRRSWRSWLLSGWIPIWVVTDCTISFFRCHRSQDPSNPPWAFVLSNWKYPLLDLSVLS